MPTDVMEHADLPIRAAHHHEGPPRETHRVDIAGIGDLMSETNADPAALEDSLHLALENVRLVIGRARQRWRALDRTAHPL